VLTRGLDYTYVKDYSKLLFFVSCFHFLLSFPIWSLLFAVLAREYLKCNSLSENVF